MSSSLLRCAHVALGTALALVLTACGGERSDEVDTATGASPVTSDRASGDPSASAEADPAAADLPACSEIWVDGATLPGRYRACAAEGQVVKPERHRCGYGRPLLEHQGRFYASPGNRVVDAGDLGTSQEFQQILQACQA